MDTKHYLEDKDIIIKKKEIHKEYQGVPSKIVKDNDFSQIHVPKKDNLGKKLRELRCARLENQEQFAKLLGISKQELNAIESGKCILENNKIQIINNKLNKLKLIKS